MKISVLLPTYNGAKYLKPTIESILLQSYKNFEVIVCDDSSRDKTISLLKSYNDPRIKIYANKTNVGYPKNLEKCRTKATGDIYFLLGQDDIIKPNYFRKLINIFKTYPNINAISRTYYWFENDLSRPNRVKPTTTDKKDRLISILSPSHDIILLIDTLDQLSGLAFRSKTFPGKFHSDVFPCHIYPFLKVLLTGPIFFVADYVVAVRTESSQTRFRKDIYNKSPLKSWVEMINNIFINYPSLKNTIIRDFVAKNYVGLFQIKNYGTWYQFFREVSLLIYYRPKNIYSPSFLLIFSLLIVLPRKTSIALVQYYKNHLLAPRINTSSIINL